jgi:hypothetical protein
MNKNLSPHSSRASGGIIKCLHCLVFIMSPLQGFRMVRGTIRRLRCATPPVIHHAAASAAILLSQNKNSTEILRF